MSLRYKRTEQQTANKKVNRSNRNFLELLGAQVRRGLRSVMFGEAGGLGVSSEEGSVSVLFNTIALWQQLYFYGKEGPSLRNRI